MNDLRICLNALFLQNHLGGIGNYCFHLARGLRLRNPGWKLTLLVHEVVAPRFRSLEGVEILAVGIRSRIGRLLYFHLLFPLRARRFDLIHSVGNMGLAFCPVPQIISIMDSYEQVSPERFSWFKRRLMTLLISHSGRKAKRIIAISENTKRDVERFYPHLRGKVERIYCGNKFPVASEAPNRDRGDFIFVGTLEPGKNLDKILASLALLRKTHPRKLVVVGAMGWKQSHISGLLDVLDLRASVKFLGYVDEAELAGLYRRALALIQASSYEGFGLPVIEAMACGCPVIAARNSGLVEAGGEAALFFETGDVRGMAGWMARLCEEPSLVEECIRKGREHARKFDWNRTAEETARAYLECLA